MYESYTRYIYQFLQEHWPEVTQTLAAVNSLVDLVTMLLQSVIFFGLLNWGFKFIRARWLTVC